ncbi:hypothetical protein TUM19329_07610 [Legionella antarctica]|uniref:Uncharacterized protein n=1 Tax=Legionella antarctica TaxID=2708020 RepID=A0A6F8T2L5_9GAMM|nr:hypothetical protein [Legionella antarctica]BCA94400.1 hypothetical protein TUM19329_07610 [Legionella antarctica]
MKKILILLALLTCASSPAIANQKERLIQMPPSFNEFTQNVKELIDPERTHLSCRLENRNIGSTIVTESWNKMLHIDNNHFFEFALSPELMHSFDLYTFEASCWTSMPEGYTCHAVFTPGNYVVDCQ